ncbi:MAG TPA: KipI antagonist [Lentisphaeria bacterium]|nr:MAG: hypothetical protein A2X47_07130 [Lentisphaerae bacterium GWF2_38_69]HBM15597.1 KipI antagonist [Lentisphaeria bacterium]
MSSIKIIKPGTQTTIQDKGRYGFQSCGMVVSGVMDSFSHRVANLLVGNSFFEAVFEVCLSGLELEFQGICVIAITGANISPSLNGLTVPMWKSFLVKSNNNLSFGRVISGCRSYIAFAGGLEVPSVLGSKSSYAKANIGMQLTAETIIEVKTPKEFSKLASRILPPAFIPIYKNEIALRVVIGSHKDYFTEDGIKKFFSSEYTVTKDCDRMGCRLEGEAIVPIDSNIISDSITYGSIQIPQNGQPIIMCADRQTTGGYPKIATVITADLPLLAQAKPGNKISFSSISVSEAQQILRNSKY